MSSNPPPDKVLSAVDRGDDTQRRFRYQAANAALYSLALLNKESEILEVFCEHHEDILIRRRDDTFIGVQIKTRETCLGPFTFSDTEILKSLKRFIEIEKTFQGKFSRYIICSNCGFWQRSDNTSNLVHCLEVVRKCNDTELSSLDGDLLGRIDTLSSETSCNRKFVANVLRKVVTEKSPDLERYEPYLAYEIANATGKKDQSLGALGKAAINLIEIMLQAASLSHSSAKEAYFELLANPQSEKTETIIQGKRITREIVQKTIDESLSSFAALRTTGSIDITDLPKGMRISELKMARGGLSAQNIDLAKDLKYSAETLLAGWVHKHGSTEAEKRYQHLSLIARNESQEAYDELKSNGRTFGEEMMKHIRNRIRQRYTNEIHNQINDCLYEHVLGIVGILTEECKIWWSEQFEMPKESNL